MTTMTMARGGSEGKSINDSISERKCIVTMIVTLFTLSLIIIGFEYVLNLKLCNLNFEIASLILY
jgi:hypothetical protein